MDAAWVTCIITHNTSEDSTRRFHPKYWLYSTKTVEWPVNKVESSAAVCRLTSILRISEDRLTLESENIT